MTNIDKNIFKGAGFILYHYNRTKTRYEAILGDRQKKLDANKRDPTPEFDTQGGGRDGDEIPDENAENELNEEVGCYYSTEQKKLISILDKNWQKRAKVLHTLYKDEWMWCFLLEVNEAEFARLKTQDQVLCKWPVEEKRDFSSVTGRKEEARLALKGLNFYCFFSTNFLIFSISRLVFGASLITRLARQGFFSV